jgi:hypothetical protein
MGFRVYWKLAMVGTYHTFLQYLLQSAPTRHFVLLNRVWFLLIKFIVFEAYFLLAPKCRVGADANPLYLFFSKHYVCMFGIGLLFLFAKLSDTKFFEVIGDR